MTQKEKELLLVDLCGRLPYGVKVKTKYYYTYQDGTLKIYNCNETLDAEHLQLLSEEDESLEEIKPYLRSMSSMTEEETVEYCDLQDKFLLSSQYPVTDGYALYDWLNKKMFDFRGLIPAGAAIAVTEDNNPYKD